MSTPAPAGVGVRSLGANVVLNATSQALLLLAGLGSIPVLTRVLAVEEYAFFAFLMLFITSMVLLDGLRPPFIQLIHRHRLAGTERGFLRVAARINAAFAAAMGLVAFALFDLLAPPKAGAWDTVLLGLATVALFLGSLPAARVAAEQRIGMVQFARSVSVACTYLLFVGLAVAGEGTTHFGAVLLAMNVALYGAYRLLARRYAPAPDRAGAAGTQTDALVILRQCGHGMATGLATTFAHFADRLLVFLMLTPAAYAAYSVAYDTALRLNAVPLMVTYPLFTWLSQHLETSRERSLRVYQGVAKGVIGVMLVLGSTAIYWADPIVHLLAGSDYGASATPFRIIVGAALLTTLSAVSASFLRATGDFRSQWRTTLAGSLVCVVAGLVLIPRYGIAGGALALLAGRFAADLSLGMVAARTLARMVRGQLPAEPLRLRVLPWLALSGGICLWSYRPLTGGIAEYLIIQGVLMGVGVWLFTDEERRTAARLLGRRPRPGGTIRPAGAEG